MKKKGKLTMGVVQCMPFGPPRIGKTCFKDRLAREKPKGKKAIKVHDKVVYPTDVSPTTGAAEEVLRLTETTFQERQGETGWSRLDLKKEIISFAKGLERADEPPIKPIKPITFPVISGKPTPLIELAKPDPLGMVKYAASKEKNPSRVKQLLEDSLTIHFTDTGGQPEFQEVLPAVVSGPSLFFLVFSLFGGLNEKYPVWYKSFEDRYESSYTVKEVMLRCLSSIACICAKRKHDDKLKIVKPKVFFIGTQRDLLDDPQGGIKEIDGELRMALEGKPELKMLVQDNPKEHLLLYTVNNYDESDARFQAIRDAVRRVVTNEEEMYKVSLPIPFAILDFYLRICKEQSHYRDSVITMEDFKVAASECNISEDEYEDALWTLQHLLGTIRHFPEVPELRNIVITNSQLFFNVVTTLITSKYEPRVPFQVRNQLEKTGIIAEKELNKLWSQEEGRHLNNAQMVALLKHLHIIAPLIYNDELSYLVPCVLPSFPEHWPSDASKHGIVAPLLVSFKCGFIPIGVFSGLLAYLLQQAHKHDLPWTLRQDRCFRTQATFYVKHHSDIISLTIKSTPNFIQFSLHQEEAEEGFRKPSDICTTVKGVIEKGLNEVTDVLNYTISKEPTFGFQCTREEQNPHIAVCTKAQSTGFSRKLVCSTCSLQCSIPSDFQDWFKGRTVFSQLHFKLFFIILYTHAHQHPHTLSHTKICRHIK